MTPDVLAQLIGDAGTAPALWREGPWLAVGERAARALTNAPGGAVRRVLASADVYSAIEQLARVEVAGCVVAAETLAGRPEDAIRQFLVHVHPASVIVLGPIRERDTRNAVHAAGLATVDPRPAPSTEAGPPRRATALTGVGRLPRADRGERPAPAGPSGGRFAAGCLERITRPAALRRYVLESFVSRSGAGRASLMLREPGRRTLRLATAHGWQNPELVGKVRVGIGAGVAGRAAATGRVLAGHGAPGGTRRYDGSAYVVVPLGRRRAHGVVNLTELPADELPGATTLKAWRQLGRRAGLALRSARRLRRAEALSTRDALTGLPNRRAFERALRRELERARRGGTGLGVALLDVDHFKAVNDDLGHQVGDRVLAEVARRLVHAFRETDLVCRWGGEEFAVLLTGISSQDATEAEAALDRSLHAVGDRPVTLGVGVPARRVTVSAGFAAWPDAGPDEAGLLRAADGALYAAKEAGRNQVCRA